MKQVIDCIMIFKIKEDIVLKSFDWEDGVKFKDFKKLRKFVNEILRDKEKDIFRKKGLKESENNGNKDSSK